MIKIIIVDDHKLFRNGLAELLKKQKDMLVISKFPDGEAFLNFLNQEKDFDIVLLDITMPKIDGFEVLKKLSKLKNNVKTIIISMHDEGNYIAKCAKNGAHGYLLKNTDEYELVKTIRTVAKGKKYFGPTISEKMINFMSEQSVSNNILSNKESEILILISNGLTTKEIASKLFISKRTVETHRANILKKLEVNNTASLIKKASQKKLI